MQSARSTARSITGPFFEGRHIHHLGRRFPTDRRRLRDQMVSVRLVTGNVRDGTRRRSVSGPGSLRSAHPLTQAAVHPARNGPCHREGAIFTLPQVSANGARPERRSVWDRFARRHATLPRSRPFYFLRARPDFGLRVFGPRLPGAVRDVLELRFVLFFRLVDEAVFLTLRFPVLRRFDVATVLPPCVR